MSHTVSGIAPFVPSSQLLLARHADCSYWMARYLERIENLARLLEVTHTFSPASAGTQNWQSVLQIHRDEEAFEKRYGSVSAPKVVRFYLTDEENSNSIHSCLIAARNNASVLRALISTEMWVQVNVMYNFVQSLHDEEMKLQDISGLLIKIRRQCQTTTGIAEHTLYRDQGWLFHLLGRHIERADQTTRLLDIKYHLLLPSLQDVGSTLDIAQWMVLLRAASGYHAFRREHAQELTPTTVTGFLLFDRHFPRSLATCLSSAVYALRHLHNDYRLPAAEEALNITVNLLQHLAIEPADSIVKRGTHEYLDDIQLRLIGIHNSVADHFFTR